MTSINQSSAELLPEDREDRVGWAYKMASEANKTRQRFDAWAEEYDRDVHDLLGWRGPELTLDHVLAHIPKNAEVLDAGSGTGLMGELLYSEGYTNLTATDISQKMLNVAREKGVYKHFFQADLTITLPQNTESTDAVVSVGVSGYMTAETITDFFRILRRGGHIIYTISDSHFDEQGFGEVVDHLIKTHGLIVKNKSEEFAALPKSNPDHRTRVHVYQKPLGSVDIYDSLL